MNAIPSLLSTRFTRLHKHRHVTAVRLAETTGMLQSMVNADELGGRRVAASTLPNARRLAVIYRTEAMLAQRGR